MRVRNSPTIQELIRDLLASKHRPVPFGDIYDYVSANATLTSKKPRASVFSVLTRMRDVKRAQPGTYMLTVRDQHDTS